jgi:preprotein translocase subunit SecG
LSTLYSVLLGIDVLIAIGLIALVLLQHGKGADAGAAFGSGASSTVFGARGSSSFLTRATAILAAGFFVNSLALAYLASQTPTVESVIERVVVEPEPQSAPADVTIEEKDQVTVEEDLPPEQTSNTGNLPSIEGEQGQQAPEIPGAGNANGGIPTQPKPGSIPNDVPQ